MKLHRIAFLLLLAVVVPALSNAQSPFDVHRFDGIPVTENGQPFSYAWMGGMNAPQFSEVDLDLDGDKDLFIFDRSGNIISTFLNNGTPNTFDYTYTEAYNNIFPDIDTWALFADYNCDGKNDLFTYRSGGVRLYKNTSNAQDGLQFELYITYMLAYDDYFQNNVGVGSSSVEIPALADIDGDGYIDMLSVFSNTGNTIAYHRNVSMSQFGTCDTFALETRNHCWGQFYSNSVSNSVTMNYQCDYNVSNPELDDVVWEDETEQRGLRDGAHSLLALDNDGDGVKDLLIGHDHFNTMTMLTNGGTTTASEIIAEENYWPQVSTPVDINYYPSAYYLDLDNDGVKDIVVCPFYELWTLNFEGVWWYKNNGTNDNPVFDYQQNDFLQGDMIDVGYGSHPVFFDYNSDGLEDMIVGNHDYWTPAGGANHPSQLAVFENVGTLANPSFDLVDRNYADLPSTGLKHALAPAFGDLDGDGDQDMMLGDSAGNLHYFQNTAPINDPAVFQLATSLYEDADNVAIDIGKFASPTFYDLDADGDLDLIIGEQSGNFNYYQNVGSTSSPSFKLMTDVLGNVEVNEWWNNQGFSQPQFFEHNGQTMLISGSVSGRISLFDDIDGNLTGTFNLVDSALFDLDIGGRSKVAWKDINNDGQQELVLGNARGGLTFFRGGEPNSIEEISEQLQFELYPNPTRNEINLRWDFPLNDQITVQIFDLVGKQHEAVQVNSQQTITIPLRNLSPGIYICVAEQGSVRVSRKFVVVR